MLGSRVPDTVLEAPRMLADLHLSTAVRFYNRDFKAERGETTFTVQVVESGRAATGAEADLNPRHTLTPTAQHFLCMGHLSVHLAEDRTFCLARSGDHKSSPFSAGLSWG